MAKSSNALKKITSNFTKYKPKSYTPVLATLLVVAAFLLGILFTKVQYLEKGQGTTVTTDAGQDSGQPTVTEKVDVDPGHLPVLGDKDAKITLVEFSDFQCPFCASFGKDTLPQIKKDYVDTGKVKLAYRHFPLDFHANAQKAAEASECANEQGKFWEYHDKLFETQSAWESQSATEALTTFSSYADELGISGANLRSCVESAKYEKAVKDDLAAGGEAGVSGTPTTYVNGYAVVGAVPYANIKAKIDEELAK